MRTESGETLPKMLPGAVCVQWVRCGKPNCRCTRGELHGPYWYRFWREDAKLRKTHVKSKDLAKVREACEARRRERRELRVAMQEFRDLLALLRRIESDDRLGRNRDDSCLGRE